MNGLDLMKGRRLGPYAFLGWGGGELNTVESIDFRGIMCTLVSVGKINFKNMEHAIKYTLLHGILYMTFRVRNNLLFYFHFWNFSYSCRTIVWC